MTKIIFSSVLEDWVWDAIETLKDDVINHPSPSLVLSAQFIVTQTVFCLEPIPAWVLYLANCPDNPVGMFSHLIQHDFLVEVDHD